MTDGSTDHEDLNRVMGKKIRSVDAGETFVELTFDDGTSLKIRSRGQGEHWVDVRYWD